MLSRFLLFIQCERIERVQLLSKRKMAEMVAKDPPKLFFAEIRREFIIAEMVNNTEQQTFVACVQAQRSLRSHIPTSLQCITHYSRPS